MPAIYAHDRFGEKVAKKLGGELKCFVFEYYPQFEIGLKDRISSFSFVHIRKTEL